MEIIGNRTFTVAVPVDADPEFKAYIMAAGSTHSTGNRSIDNIRRRHCDRCVRYFEEQQVINDKGLPGLRRLIVRKATSRCMEISELNVGNDSGAGKFAAAKVLIRLESTFRAASQLIQLGYAFESEAVIRLGLEQVAWAHAVRDMADVALVRTISGTRSITKLKTVFPGVGRIYNRLSDLAHVAPKTHERFVADVDGNISVRIKDPLAATESIRLLLFLLDAFLVISERLFQREGIPCQSIDRESEGPKIDRPVHKLVDQFEPVLPRDTAGLFDVWWK